MNEKKRTNPFASPRAAKVASPTLNYEQSNPIDIRRKDQRSPIAQIKQEAYFEYVMPLRSPLQAHNQYHHLDRWPFHLLEDLFHYLPCRAWFLLGMTCKTLRELTQRYPIDSWDERYASLSLRLFRLNQTKRDAVLRATHKERVRGGVVPHCFNCLQYSCYMQCIQRLVVCRHCKPRLFATRDEARRFYFLDDADLRFVTGTTCAAGTVCYLKRDLWLRACTRYGEAELRERIANDLNQFRRTLFERTRSAAPQRRFQLAVGGGGAATNATTTIDVDEHHFIMASEHLLARVEELERFVYCVPDPINAEHCVPWIRQQFVVVDTGEVVRAIPRHSMGWYAQLIADEAAARDDDDNESTLSDSAAEPVFASQVSAAAGLRDAEAAAAFDAWRTQYAVDDECAHACLSLIERIVHCATRSAASSTVTSECTHASSSSCEADAPIADASSAASAAMEATANTPILLRPRRPSDTSSSKARHTAAATFNSNGHGRLQPLGANRSPRNAPPVKWWLGATTST